MTAPDTAALPRNWVPSDRDQIGLLNQEAGKPEQWELDGWLRVVQITRPHLPEDQQREWAEWEATFYRKLPGGNGRLLADLAFYDHHGVLPDWMRIEFPTPEAKRHFMALLFAWQDGQPVTDQPRLGPDMATWGAP